MVKKIEQLYSKSTASMKHSFIRQILKVTKGVPGMISFAGGLPSPDTFPKNLLADLFAVVIRPHKTPESYLEMQRLSRGDEFQSPKLQWMKVFGVSALESALRRSSRGQIFNTEQR